MSSLTGRSRRKQQSDYENDQVEFFHGVKTDCQI